MKTRDIIAAIGILLHGCWNKKIELGKDKKGKKKREKRNESGRRERKREI